MFSRPPLNTYVLLVGVTTTACHSMAHVSRPVESDDRTFEIGFNPARNIEGVRADGSRITLAAVTRASGNPVAVRGDTVTMHLGWWKSGNPANESSEPMGVNAMFAASDAGVSYYQRRVSVMKSAVLVGTIVGLVALGIGQADTGSLGTIGYPLLPFPH